MRPLSEIGVENRCDRRRDSLDGRVADGLLVVLDASAAAGHGADVVAVAAGFEDGLVILEGEVLALFGEQEMLDVGLNGRHFRDDENVGTEVENFRGDVVLNAGDEGHHGNYGGDADHDAEQREHGAQLIRPQRAQRDSDGFGDVHGAGVGRQALDGRTGYQSTGNWRARHDFALY